MKNSIEDDVFTQEISKISKDIKYGQIKIETINKKKYATVRDKNGRYASRTRYSNKISKEQYQEHFNRTGSLNLNISFQDKFRSGTVMTISRKPIAKKKTNQIYGYFDIFKTDKNGKQIKLNKTPIKAFSNKSRKSKSKKIEEAKDFALAKGIAEAGVKYTDRKGFSVKFAKITDPSNRKRSYQTYSRYMTFT